MKKFILSFVLMMLMCTSIVNANSINSITMDIYIDGSGDAQVTEIWDCTTNQGTESYHPYYNLGESEITNLQVKDEDGVTYTPVSYWDVNGGFESKKYKCGINQISDGVELCWGISEYGRKTYTVNYEISNFVVSLSDSQMVYWTLMPHDFSNTIGNIEITVRADKKFEDTLEVWGYGEYGAPAYVYDGVVKMHSDGSMTSDEYKVLLIKFPTGTFNTSVSLNDNFEYYLDMADEGSVKYSKEKISEIIKQIFEGICFIVVSIVFMLFAAVVVYGSIGIIAMLFLSFFAHQEISKEQKEKIEKASYYRDIPCDKDIFMMFYIVYTTGLMKNKTDIIGALILKWLKEAKISIGKQENDTFVILDRNTANEIINKYEKTLYLLLYKASKDGILEKKELERWCNKNYKTILGWFDKVLNEEREKLPKNSFLYVTTEGIFFKKKKIHFSDSLLEEAIKISGLKRYLNYYTLIYEREAVEVALFEEYLIFAQLVGIAKKVAKEFEDLYPEVIEASSFKSYNNIMFIDTVIKESVRIVEKRKIGSTTRNYSSGGGGFSSSNGGGGSFGGGSRGGGGFR